MPKNKKHEFDEINHVYDYTQDDLALLSSMMDNTLGPRLYESILEDLGIAEENPRIKPANWESVEEIKNIRASFNTSNDADKIIKLTLHSVQMLDSYLIPEKIVTDGAKIVDKAATQLKKKFKELSGHPLKLSVVKPDGVKTIWADFEPLNNPRTEVAIQNAIAPKNYIRCHVKVSKFYRIDPRKGEE